MDVSGVDGTSELAGSIGGGIFAARVICLPMEGREQGTSHPPPGSEGSSDGDGFISQ